MANLNRVMLVGRLTREPEITEFKNGGKLANLGFTVHNKHRNAQTGEWEEVPVWLNLKAYNREPGRKLADLAGLLHKGREMFVEGHLVLEQWNGKDDNKHHSRLLVYVDDMELMGGRQEEEEPEPGPVDHAPGEHVADAGWHEEEAPKPARGGRRKKTGAV